MIGIAKQHNPRLNTGGTVGIGNRAADDQRTTSDVTIE